MAVANDKVKVSLLQEMILDAAHDGGGVAIADFGDDDANGEAALSAQGAGKKVGTVFIFSGGGKNSVFGFRRDGVGDGRTIDDERDSGRRKSEALRQLLEADRFRAHAHGARARGPLFCRHDAQSRINRIGLAS